MKKKLISLALAVVMVVTMGTPVLAASRDFPFEDVPSDHWARQAVYYCWSENITEGTSGTKFEPDSTLTRAQFITMIGRAVYEDKIQAQTISSDSWYSGYVRYLSNNGYLNGIATDEVSLSQGMPRQEMALIIYNICNGYNSEFNLDYSDALNDVPDTSEISSEYKDAVEYCYYIGLLTGYEDGSFNPSGTLTRAEAATVLRRIYYWGKVSVIRYSWLTEAGLNNTVLNEIMLELVINDINNWREENGLNRLENLEFMNEACMVRSEEISDSFSHTRPDGSTCFSIYDDLYKDEFAVGASGENIVMAGTLGNESLTEMAYRLVELWKESPGHNANMLTQIFNYIGAGVYITDYPLLGTCIYSATQFCDRYGIITDGICEWIFPA